MPPTTETPVGETPPGDRTLLSKIHVVDTASLQFTETGRPPDDSWDIDWETTPEPPSRLAVPPPMRPPVEPEEEVLPPEPTAEPVFIAPAPLEPAPRRPQRHDLRPPAGQRPRMRGEMETMPEVFEGIHPSKLLAEIEHFDVMDAFSGETLIGEGERHPALVMILRGGLLKTNAMGRQRVLSGEVLGLTTLFGSGRWNGTLTTKSDCRLMVLELDGYQELRSRGSSLSLAIEDFALERLLERLRDSSKRVGELVEPRPLEEFVPPKGFFARWSEALGMGGIQPTSVDVAAGLLGSPAFRNARPEDLGVLVDRFDGIKATAGEYLCTQGEPSSALYVIVSGSVDVLSAAGRNKAVCHETLGPGDLFGAWNMLRTSGGWASYLVTQPTVLLELEKVAWAEFAHGRSSEGSVLRLAVLRSLTRRLVTKDAQIAALEGGMEPMLTATQGDGEEFVTINPAIRR